MSEIYNDRIKVLLSDDVLIEAVKRIFDQTITESLPEVHTTTPDEVIGQAYRAHHQATQIVEDAFIKIRSLNTQGQSGELSKKHR